MKLKLSVPFGKLAAENDAAAKIREQLAKDLKNGKPIDVASTGGVSELTGERKKLLIKEGKLASTPVTFPEEHIDGPYHSEEGNAAARIRASLAKDLREGKPIDIASTGGVSDLTGEQKELLIKKGKLADYQWYEREPERLNAEKEGMNHFFPQFKLHKMNDGRYYWHGTLRPGVLSNGWEWEVAAIYNNDHPAPHMGGSVRVVLLKPTIETVINSLGWRPHHLLYDEVDGTYLCTTRADDISYQQREETTAVQTLAWAVKWLTALELVLSGDLSKDQFNEPNGI